MKKSYYYKLSRDYDKLFMLMDRGMTVLGYATKEGMTDSTSFFVDGKGNYYIGTNMHIHAAAFQDGHRTRQKVRDIFRRMLVELEAEYIEPEEEDED